jgi:hypothetical protein
VQRLPVGRDGGGLYAFHGFRLGALRMPFVGLSRSSWASALSRCWLMTAVPKCRHGGGAHYVMSSTCSCTAAFLATHVAVNGVLKTPLAVEISVCALCCGCATAMLRLNSLYTNVTTHLYHSPSTSTGCCVSDQYHGHWTAQWAGPMSHYGHLSLRWLMVLHLLQIDIDCPLPT